MTDTTRADLEALIHLNEGVAELEQRRDAAALRDLDKLISPDLIFRRADGSVVGKPEFMTGLHGPSPFTRRVSEDISVTVVGTRALAVLTVATTKADGTKPRYRNVRVLTHRDGAWSIEAWFNDDVTDLLKRR